MQNIGPRTGFRSHAADFGRVSRMLVASFSARTLRRLDSDVFKHYFTMMGLRSLPLITFGAVFVSLALTTQVVLEAERFNAQDITGAAIAIGLLRELAPLTVGLAWAGRTSAFLTETAFVKEFARADEFESRFLAPAYLAGIVSAIPLAAYGLVIGFGAAALFAPVLGVTSSADFLESARLAIKDKDVGVYLVKLILINPTVVIFATSLAALSERETPPASVTASAVTYACIGVFIMNLICTWAWYLP